MSARFTPEAFVFDFDGTMVDSEAATLEIAKPIISKHLGREVMGEEMDGLKGKVWKKEFRRWFPDTHYQVYNEIVEAWELTKPVIEPYHGIAEVIIFLHRKRIPLGIASSREARLVREILENLGWEGYFGAVVGQEDTEKHKPEPHPLIKAAEILDVSPDDCIYIGDQAWDIQSSRAAGMLSGAALWGEGRIALLKNEKPDFMFHSPGDVIGKLF